MNELVICHVIWVARETNVRCCTQSNLWDPRPGSSVIRAPGTYLGGPMFKAQSGHSLMSMAKRDEYEMQIHF